ncbi:hypothetical protein [Hydrogenophaga sp. 2FB]|uniref:hypothetical protein n=1 Tax=Hydrogenophaga sp. 2FB TaxID=2502187 RepID=UPI0010F505D5|nr:hypothetical protein [Hydrogenophaga sp. 2FB]
MFKAKPTTAAEIVPRVMSGWASQYGLESGSASAFSISGEMVPNSEVGAKLGLLPLLCWHADKIYRYGMGAHLNLHYRTNPTALLGVTVDLSRIDKPISEVLCFMVEALLDLHKNSPASSATPGSVDLAAVVDQFKSEVEMARDPVLAAADAGRATAVAP